MRLSRILFSVKTVAKNIMPMPEKEITVKAPWGKISILTWGDESNQPVLLCHGRQDVCSSFRPLIQRLPSDYYYVSVELPGNGKSEPMPKGVTLSTFDFIPTIKTVTDHFKWDKFMYIGHSLGVIIGKYYAIAYPGKVTKMVELDPVPAYITYSTKKLADWYHAFYGNYYSEEQYKKNNLPNETAPKHSYEKVLEQIMNLRILDREAAKHVVERAITPAGDGLYRYTFDQRMKQTMWLPFSSDYMKSIYTDSTIPTLCVLATNSIQVGLYDTTPFIQDESEFKNNNYRVLTVDGYHDVHLNNPERISDAVANFLNDGLKAKL